MTLTRSIRRRPDRRHIQQTANEALHVLDPHLASTTGSASASAVLLRKQFQARTGGPIATDGKRIFAVSNHGALQRFTTAALEPATGRVIWRRSLGGLVFAAPLSAGGSLIVPGAFGTVFEFDAATGRARDDGALSEASACAPSSTRGRVFTGTGAAPFLPGDSLICLGELLE